MVSVPSFIFCGKKIIVNTLERIARSYELYIRREGDFFSGVAHGICCRRLLIEKIVLRWNEYSFCFYMRPDEVRIMDQMASRLSVRPQESFIKTDTYKGIHASD